MRNRRRELRKRSTEAEIKLWEALKNFRWKGLPFRRQYSIDWYILDFYCPKLKLVIEVDGSIHDEPEVMSNDSVRENYLRASGMKILRFKNDDILQNISSVIRQIEIATDASISPLPPSDGGKGI